MACTCRKQPLKFHRKAIQKKENRNDSAAQYLICNLIAASRSFSIVLDGKHLDVKYFSKKKMLDWNLNSTRIPQ